jgi:tetratricopeptide (TPR) repeat protein
MGNKTSIGEEVLPVSSPVASTIGKSLRIVHFTDSNFTEKVLSNKESITLIWLDENMHRHLDETAEIEDLLKQINNYVLVCSDRETCIQSIREIQQEKVVLLISGSCSNDVLSKVHNFDQLDSIFIFCMKPERYQTLLEMYTKITGIYINQNELMGALDKTITTLTKQITAFNLFNQDNEKQIRDFIKDSAEYVWSQLITEVIEKLPNREREYSKQDMIQRCRDYYRRNKHTLKGIDQFEQTYQSSSAIWWYTKPDSFISRLLIKALRIKDIDLLYLFRFFIIDLHKQLKTTSLVGTASDENPIYVHRGSKLSTNEIHKLKENTGHFISTNGFLSTSQNREVAIIFATNVLFEIETDVAKEGHTWFDIAQQSAIPHEEEVLFDIGATFRIQSVNYDVELKLWLIKLVASVNNDVEGCLHGNNIEILFGELYYHMGNYETSKQYFNVLLKHLKDDYRLNDVSANNDYMKLKDMYDIETKNHITKPISDEISILVMIAVAYKRSGNYKKAMKTLEKAMDLLLKLTEAN